MILAVAVAGCSSSKGSEALAHRLEIVASYGSSVDLIAESWLGGHVPNAYAAHMAENGARSLSRLYGVIEDLDGLSPTTRSAALQATAELETAVTEAAPAFEKGDRASLGPPLERIREVGRRVHELARAAGSKR